MSLLMPVLGVTFAAFGVGLMVRLINRGWKPGRRFWITAPLVVALAYPLSFGPTAWLCTGSKNVGGVPYPQLPRLYWPVGWVYVRLADHPRIHYAMSWYATRIDEIVLVSTEPSGTWVTVCRPR